MLSLVLIILGIASWFLAIHQKQTQQPKAWAFVLSGILFGVSLYTYTQSLILMAIIPLIITILVIFNARQLIAVSKSNCHCHLVGLAVFLFFFCFKFYLLTFSIIN